jgi:hypothetical protein
MEYAEADVAAARAQARRVEDFMVTMEVSGSCVQWIERR